MLKRIALAAVLSAIMVVAGSPCVLASGQVARFRIGGLYGAAMADHEDMNETIDDVGSLWNGVVDAWSDEEVGGGPVMGVFAEYLMNDRLAIGAEFLRLSGSGGYDWRVEVDDEYGYFYMGADVNYDATANVASLYGVYRLPLGDSPATVRLGAGIGYLFDAKFVLDFGGREEFELWRAPTGRQDTTVVWQTDVEASGSAIVFHGLLGVEYRLTDQLLMTASASYRIARVDELEVDDASTRENGHVVDTWWDLEEGEALKWYDGDMGSYFSTDQGDLVGLDFGGLQFTLGLAYAF